jgi:hypothetical protein
MNVNSLWSVNTATHALENEFPELSRQKCDDFEQSEQFVNPLDQMITHISARGLLETSRFD